MKKETRLPRRRFLAVGTLAACALLVPRAHGISKSVPVNPTPALNDDDKAVIAELAAYSASVSLWGGPVNFILPRTKAILRVKTFTKFLVEVTDFNRLVLYLNSGKLGRFGWVFASGPNLAFVVGSTAYMVTNYSREDFRRAVR